MIRIQWRLFCVIFVLLAISCVREDGNEPAGGTNGTSTGEESALQGEVRIKFTADAVAGMSLRSGAGRVGVEQIDMTFEKFGVSEVEQIFPDEGKFAEARRRHGLHLWYAVKLDERDDNLTRAIADLRSLPGIEAVEQPSPIVRIGSGEPAVLCDSDMLHSRIMSVASTYPFNDPGLPLQWAFKNTGSLVENGESVPSFIGVTGADINLFPAWGLSAGHPDIIVAVTDGGIDQLHPDLMDNLWVNEAERDGMAGEDDDGNGMIDDISGWNFIYGTPEISSHHHGTHVAGIIGAVNNNGNGVSGIAGGSGASDGVKLMNCQIFEYISATRDRICSDQMVGKTFIYSAESGAVISQNSWGYGFVPPSGEYGKEYIKECIAYFIDVAGTDGHGNQTGPMKGGLVIFASGNDNMDYLDFPSSLDNVIGVAGMSPNFKKPNYSNYGTWIDLTAPGGADAAAGKYNWVLSTYYDHSAGIGESASAYAFLPGTSMAAPMVSGVAALVVSKYREDNGGDGLTPGTVRAMLENTAQRNSLYYYNPSYYGKLGTGLVDAYAALSSHSPAPPTVDVPLSDIYFDRIGQRKEVDLTDHFHSASGEALNYYFDTSDPDLVTVGVLDNKLYVTSQKSGSGEVKVMASNSNSATASSSFRVMARDGTKPIDLFPNPVLDKMNIRLGEDVEGPAQFTIYNAAGSKVFDEFLTVDPFETTIIDVSVIGGGIYTLVVRKDGNEIKSNFIKY